MKKKTLTIKLLISLFMVLFCVSGDAADNNKESFNIVGDLCDDSPDFSREKLARFEESTEQSLTENLWDIIIPRPVSGTTIKLQGKNFVRETKTDSEGKFEFMNVPSGLYRISCEFKSKEKTINIKRNIIGYSRTVDVRLLTGLLNIKGRIVDQRGKPIAKAKISAEEVLNDEEYSSPKFFACSDSQGEFELTGVPTTGMYDLLAYLTDGHETALTKLKITVDAPDFAIKELFVYSVANTKVKDTLILFNSFNKVAVKHGEKKKEVRTNMVPFPKSEGNTITGIDIILEKTDDK
jgi:hypothetical protein